MKNNIKSFGQQGQAIVELCVCLVPILTVLLGMIFIAGLSISNIRTFIQAKGNAEILSRHSDVVGGAGDSIHSWDYGNPQYGGDDYPFTADDKIVDFYQAGAESGVETLINEQLNMLQGSESLIAEEGREYVFLPTAALPRVDDNFSQDMPSSMLTAANLIEATANSNLNKVFTIDSKHFSNDEIKQFNFSFTHLFGISIDDIDLRNMRANTVYYPALPTE